MEGRLLKEMGKRTHRMYVERTHIKHVEMTHRRKKAFNERIQRTHKWRKELTERKRLDAKNEGCVKGSDRKSNKEDDRINKNYGKSSTTKPETP